ncbi:unnamed protein product [Clonostachys rosea]|uniref:Aflatoxin regulatory protein domain-containing protein n=1 Tax=Bionectria ochroleuca TaxID=29856 RepID=A0ABY6TQH0_BIOOC|nr:unnamed protein product [Clonostachys rosea]
MKGLMPLALSPASSHSSTPLSGGEMIESHVDGYFPELLAKDLERSAVIIASRNLPLGNAETKTSEAKGAVSSHGWPSRYPQTPQYQPASRPSRQLGSIQERRSVVSFVDHGAHTDYSTTDDDSFYANEGYISTVGPSSVAYHELTTSTAATSLASNVSVPSLNKTLYYDPTFEHSWIDPDSDSDEPDQMVENHIGSLSPRPPTPPVSELGAMSPQHNGKVARRSSTRSRRSARPPNDSNPSTQPHYDDSDSDEVSNTPRKTPQSPVFIRPSPPPSPLPTVQSWLHGNALPYASQCQGEDLAKAIPLPPNIMETLRVSIACFPETMLLTSSLTIETIRNYSRKVRQPSIELVNNLVPDSPVESSRKSLWKRVVTYKRGSSSSPRDRTRSPSPTEQSLRSPSSSSLPSPSPKTWLPLKSVFGCCSDYICEALWAHIVAYNYISALIPRAPPQAKSNRHRSSTSNDSLKDEIPRKAASILGIAASQGGAIPNMERPTLKIRTSSSWTLNKERMVAEQSSRAASHENSTREIQTGLMRCIVRLIATAQLMSEDGKADEKIVEMETRGVDMLFTRSLCEIVRMSEDFHNHIGSY